MIDPESKWTERFANLKPDGVGTSWAGKMASAVAEGVPSMGITGVTGSVSFTWQKSIFEGMIQAAVASPAAIAGAQVIANAWMSSVLSSVMMVASGAFVVASSPATTFSVVATSIIDPPSISIGYSALLSLLTSSVPVPDPNLNMMGIALYTAFKSLTVTITGINSVAPTPAPLIVPLLPVL